MSVFANGTEWDTFYSRQCINYIIEHESNYNTSATTVPAEFIPNGNMWRYHCERFEAADV